MKVLVIGGTKFIGRAIVRIANAQGHDVAVFHRGETEPEVTDQAVHIHGDNLTIMSQIDEISGFAPDVAIDTTQFDTERTEAVVSALTGVVDRYVLLSSMDVYVAYGRLHRTELGPLQPMPMNEDAELRKLPGFGLTETIDNLLAEKVVLNQSALPATVTRLPGVFGPFDYQRRVESIVDKLEESDGVVKLHPIQANFRWSWGYVDNVAEMILLAAGDHEPGNHIYNIGFPEGISVEEQHRMVADAIDWSGEIVVAEDGTEPPEQNLAQHWIADTSKFRRDFDFREQFSIEEAFKLTVENAKLHGNSDHD